MSLKYTSNFASDLSLGQIRTSSKEKQRGGSKRYFKSQIENYEISVCLSGFMYVSVYVSFFFSDNIVEVVNEF